MLVGGHHRHTTHIQQWVHLRAWGCSHIQSLTAQHPNDKALPLASRGGKVVCCEKARAHGNKIPSDVTWS